MSMSFCHRGLVRLLSTTTSPNQALRAQIKALLQDPNPTTLAARFIDLSTTTPRFRSMSRLYLSLVLRLAAASRRDAVADVLESQKRLPNLTEGFAVRLVSLYGKARMPDHAETTFEHLPDMGFPHSLLSFNALLSALVHALHPGRALELFSSIPAGNPTIVPDLYSFNTALHARCLMKDLTGAYDVFRGMEEKGVRPNVITFTTLIDGFYKNGESEEAEKVWELMRSRSVEPDVKCYNAKMRSLASEGRLEGARRLLEEMKLAGVNPDGYTYTALVMGHCKSGDLEEAKKVLEEMRRRNCEPNRGTFEVLLPLACERGELEMAFRLGKDCVRRKCLVAGEVLQRVVDELAKEKRLEDAKALVQAARSSNRYSNESLKLPGDLTEVESEVNESL